MTLLPLQFTQKPEAIISLADREEFCNDEEPITITLEPPNQNTDLSNVNWVQTTIGGQIVAEPVLDPRQFAKNGNRESLEIQVLLRDRRIEDCENIISKTVTIYPLPDAEFKIVPQFSPQPDLPPNTFCAGNGESPKVLRLEPNNPDTSDYFEVNGQRISTNQIDLNKYGQEGEEILKVVHHTISVGVCSSQVSEQTITVLPLPNATFNPRVTDPDNPDAVCSNEIIELNPRRTGGTFKAFIQGSNQEILDAIEYDENGKPRFIASKVFGDDDLVSLPVTLHHEITSEQGCPNNFNYFATVYRAPIGNFECSVQEVLSDPDNTEAFSIQIFNIQPTSEGAAPYQYRWKFGLEPDIELNKTDSDPFSVDFPYEGIDLTSSIPITLTVVNNESPQSLSCSGGLVEKTITPPFGIVDWVLVIIRGQNEFERLEELTNLIKRNPRVGRSQFTGDIELTSYAIQVKTRPTRVGNVQIKYQAPDGSEQETKENNPPYTSPSWKPNIGLHNFTAQAFAGADVTLPAEGSPLTIKIEIFDDRNDDDVVVRDNGSGITNENVDSEQVPTPNGDDSEQPNGSSDIDIPIATKDSSEVVVSERLPGDEASVTELLAQRLSHYQTQLRELGKTNESLHSNRAFTEAANFLANEEKSIETYATLAGIIYKAFRPFGTKRKAGLTQIFALATAALFDSLAQEGLAEEQWEQLSKILNYLRKKRLNFKSIRDIWEIAPLNLIADRTILEHLEALL